MTKVTYLDKPPAGWFVLDVMRQTRRSWNWVALMVDVDPDEAQARYQQGRKARSCWVRIPGKHRDRDAAWERLQELIANPAFTTEPELRGDILRRMLNAPGNDMIVMPFHHQIGWWGRGYIHLRDERGLYATVAHDHFEPDPNRPGSCVQ